MFARYSAENQILAAIGQLGVSINFIGGLQDHVSASRLSMALNGTLPLPAYQLEPILALLYELQALQAEHQPVRILWKDTRLYREILQRRRTAAVQQ